MPQPPSDPVDSFRDRCFLVIGASGGIGSCLTRSLATRGARLAIAARRADPLEALEVDPVATLSCDARDADQVEACVTEASRTLDGLDGIALCVGSILIKPAHLTTSSEWDEVLAQNLTTAFHVVRAAGKVLRKGGGSIVLCSSAAAGVGMPSHEAIAAAKGGLEALVRTAASSYASRGLRFNAVAPGLVRTPLAASIVENERALEQSEAMHPLGRIGEPEDVASAILWLLDPANDWITGEILRVDGGLASVRGPARKARS